MTNKTNLRAAAAKIICDLIAKGRSLADSLPEIGDQLSDPRDNALLQAICYGVCRWYFRLEAIVKQLLEKPLKQKDMDIYALILVGIYQLSYMRIPEYAAISETVAAAKHFKKIWAKSLINGILRQYQRHAEQLNKNVSLESDYSHPLWMIERIKQAYKHEWENILNANNQHPPFSLRVNQQKISRDNYLEKLSTAGLKAEIIPVTQSGIVLENPIDVNQLPGFLQGEVSVQDGAAQLAAELLMLEPNQRVLDACAAPGGKTAHILEMQPTIECIAIDHDETRLASVKETLQRLHFSAKCIASDVANVKEWWDEKYFDRILLDAPCSASGVIRRHPDIKLLRRDTDIEKLAQTQLRLLNAVWETLKPGGILLYATCSIFPDENNQVLQQFIDSHKDAKEEKIVSAWGIDSIMGKQILPGMHNMDGFYFARLRKS